MPRLADLAAVPQDQPATVPTGTLRNLNDPMMAVQKAETIGAPTYPPMMGRMPMGPGLAQGLAAAWNTPEEAGWVAKRLLQDNLMSWAGDKAKEILKSLRGASR